MAVRLKKKKTFESRQVLAPLPRIAVAWTSPFNEETWKQLQQPGFLSTGKLPDGSVDLPEHVGRSIYFGPAFNDDDHTLISAICYKGRQEKPTKLAWSVVTHPRPEAKPPKDVMAMNERVGRRSGMVRLLNAHLEKERPVAEFRISARFNHKQWICKLIPRPIARSEGIVGDIGKKVALEQIGYRLEDGALGIREITLIYDDGRDEIFLTILGSSPVKLNDAGEFPIAREMYNFVVSRLLDVRVRSNEAKQGA